jgi:threonine/homoserine/homoserine lactone efflux protein
LSRELSLLATISGVYLAAVVSPGPNTFVVTRLALAEGRKPAVVAVFGIGVGNSCWLALTLAGAHLLFERFPVLGMGIRLIGSAYLGWLGFQALRAAYRGGDLLARMSGPTPVEGSSFRAGLVTSLTNPNTLPFYLTLLGVTVAPEVPFWLRFAAAGTVLLLCVLWYGGLALSFSLAPVQRWYRRWGRLVNLVLAGALLHLAWRLIRG